MGRERSAWIAAHMIGAALLLWVAIANGFPLLFADSGAYLRIGTELRYPLDRPATYGLAILPLYRAGGLWAVTIAQALFTTWLIGRVLRTVAPRRPALWLLIATALLAAGSSLPWFAGQIMPDLFTGCVALLIYLLVCADDDLGRGERIVLPPLLAGLIAFHLSFVAIAAAVIAGAFVLGRVAGVRGTGAGALRAAAAVLLAILALSTMNLLAEGQFRPSLASDKFMLARLLDGRMGQPVLAEECAVRRIPLCVARPQVDDPADPLPGQTYLWDAHSPRIALERADPAGLQAQEALIVRRTLATRPGALARLVVASWGRQFVTARSGDGLIRYGRDMQVDQQVERHFPAAVPAWRRSCQQSGTIGALGMVPDRAIGLAIAALLPILFGLALRRGDRHLAALCGVALIALAANAGVCSILSGVFDRYQARVMWLPLLAAVCAAAGFRRPAMPRGDAGQGADLL